MKSKISDPIGEEQKFIFDEFALGSGLECEKLKWHSLGNIFHQISAVPAQEIPPPCLKNQPSSLGYVLRV